MKTVVCFEGEFREFEYSGGFGCADLCLTAVPLSAPTTYIKACGTFVEEEKKERRWVDWAIRSIFKKKRVNEPRPTDAE
jgi:hypothetical protein